MAELTLDAFNDDAFSLHSLTDTIEDLQFVPGRLGELGIFAEDSISTTLASFEKRGTQLTLIQPTPRGGPGVTTDKKKREMRALEVPHFQIDDAIYAEEVQGIRKFGTTSELEQLSDKVAGRLSEHNDSVAATEEHARMGAVKGTIVYADGSSTDLFKEFGVTRIPEINFALGTAKDGALRATCSKLVRTVSDELGALRFTGIHALCGDDFFDALLKNVEVRETYKGWSDAQILREGYLGPNRSTYGIFEFGNIVFENYRGSVNGTDFIEADKVQLFPMGVRGLFKSIRSPADYIETVNTPGRRVYAKQYRMLNDKGVHLEVQTNSLHVCTRPRVLLKGKL